MKIAFVAILLFSAQVSFSQSAITEDQVDFNILKWHFHHYPKSTTQQWYDMGEGVLKAEFTFNDLPVSTTYNSAGKRIDEQMDITKEVPVSVSFYLDERYEKYKVQQFVKSVNFTTKEVRHILELRTKNQGIVFLKFDENLVPIESELISISQ